MLTNYTEAVSLVIGLVLPALVALFTKPSTNPTVKGAAHAVLSVAAGSAAVYKADPQHFAWAPAVVAAFLAWLTGTAFYHSLLKKYTWFSWLQNAVVREVQSLHTGPAAEEVSYFEQALEAEESGPLNNFPLSTDEVVQDPGTIAPSVSPGGLDGVQPDAQPVAQ